MNTEDMLERAAKAAGIELIDRALGAAGYVIDGAKYWNPLANDDDAFRLALSLNMSIDIDEHESSTYVYAGSVSRSYAWELWRDDKAAATRLAIVRAAAALSSAQGEQG